MSVLLETSLGDVVVDLFTQHAPKTSDNFIKLCAIKYYNDCTFHTIRPGLYIQTGDPTNTGTGGASIHRLIAERSAAPQSTDLTASRFLEDEFHPALTHASKYTVSMVNLGVPNSNASQFFITTAADLQSLDATHTVFGRVAEGMDVVDRISAQPVDERGRPTSYVRIRHTIVLDDPFPTPPALLPLIPPHSPPPVHDPYDYESIQARAQPPSTSSPPPPSVNPHAVVLEMIGDLPSADAAPAENVLFVCKLNPVTRSEDLELIFARFGPVRECAVVRDKEGNSLCYAFVEYAEKEHCEAAYLKMDGVVVDDRRIRVDFSQSVARQWKAIRRRGHGAGSGGRGGAMGAVSVVGRDTAASARSSTRWGGRSDAANGVSERRDERKDGRDVDPPRERAKDERRGSDEDRGRSPRRERSRSRERSQHSSSHHHHHGHSKEREERRHGADREHHRHRHSRHSRSRSRSPRRR